MIFKLWLCKKFKLCLVLKLLVVCSSQYDFRLIFCPILPQSSCTRSVGYFQQLDICRAVSTILVCVCILCNFLTKTFRQLASFLIKMFLFFRNIHYFHKLLNAKQVQQKNKCPLTVSSTIRFKWPTWHCCYSHGRRKIWKSGGRVVMWWA